MATATSTPAAKASNVYRLIKSEVFELQAMGLLALSGTLHMGAAAAATPGAALPTGGGDFDRKPGLAFACIAFCASTRPRYYICRSRCFFMCIQFPGELLSNYSSIMPLHSVAAAAARWRSCCGRWLCG